MKKISGLCASLALCASPMSSMAGEIDLSFNSDAVRAFYMHDFAGRDLQGDLGFANNSDKGTVINGSIYVTGFASDGEHPLRAGIGVRAAGVDGDESDQSGLATGLGGFANYTLPDSDRFSIRGDIWYAPDILSFGDIEKYQDMSLRVQYALLHEADLYIGIRYLKAEFGEGNSMLLDNGAHIGINFRF